MAKELHSDDLKWRHWCLSCSQVLLFGVVLVVSSPADRLLYNCMHVVLTQVHLIWQTHSFVCNITQTLALTWELIAVSASCWGSFAEHSYFPSNICFWMNSEFNRDVLYLPWKFAFTCWQNSQVSQCMSVWEWGSWKSCPQTITDNTIKCIDGHTCEELAVIWTTLTQRLTLDFKAVSAFCWGSFSDYCIWRPSSSLALNKRIVNLAWLCSARERKQKQLVVFSTTDVIF